MYVHTSAQSYCSIKFSILHDMQLIKEYKNGSTDVACANRPKNRYGNIYTCMMSLSVCTCTYESFCV